MSMVSRADHSVSFCTEQTLAVIAAKVRKLADINNAPTFNIVNVVNWLVSNISKFLEIKHR